MSDRPTPPDPMTADRLDAIAGRIEAAVLEATRDLKGYTVRELDMKLARIEEQFERRVADVEVQLQGVNAKLVAIRNEFHQSLRDQTLKLAVLGLSALALAVAVLLSITRWWR